MSAAVDVDDDPSADLEDRVAGRVGDLADRAAGERRRIAAEADAFGRFLARIEDVAVRGPPPSEDGRAPGAGRPPGLVAVRRAYEATVMAVPHYETEYGDGYRESLAEEFGRAMAVVLATGFRFDAGTKRELIRRTRESRENRRRFGRTLRTEAESVASVGADLRTLAAEVAAADGPAAEDPGYGTLEAHWARLDALADRCEELGRRRQEDVDRQRREFRLPRGAPDIPHYLYQGFDDRYPLLALIAELAERIGVGRRRLERRLAEAG